VGRQHECELDLDYKLPKIVKNYKGLPVQNFEIGAYPPTKVVKMLSPETAESGVGDARKKAVRMDSVVATASTSLMVDSEKRPSVTTASLSAAAAAPSTSVPPPVPTPAPAPWFRVNQEWQVKYATVLLPRVSIVHVSTIVKRNQMGMGVKRQLILTDLPSLFYVAIANSGMIVIKGELNWDRKEPPQAVVVSNHCLLFYY
jgi:hypothetical protein